MAQLSYFLLLYQYAIFNKKWNILLILTIKIYFLSLSYKYKHFRNNKRAFNDKVLGFYDNEVTMYIYRETILLSAIGIVFGCIFGMFLHTYILNVVPPDEIMLNPAIVMLSYIVSIITITVVTII